MSDIGPELPSVDNEPRTKSEKINRALKDARKIAETKPEDSLSPLDTAKKHTFLTSLDRTEGSADRTYDNTFTNLETGEEIHQKEGIVVDWAIQQLKEEAMKGLHSWADKTKLALAAKLLRENS